MTTFILRGRAIFLLAISMFGAGAVPAMPASLGPGMIGHWQLEAVDVSGNAPYGAKPQGSMFLDATGHYSVIVISDGGARSIAYFGTYRTDDAAGTVIFHVTGASQPARRRPRSDASRQTQRRRTGAAKPAVAGTACSKGDVEAWVRLRQSGLGHALLARGRRHRGAHHIIRPANSDRNTLHHRQQGQTEQCRRREPY